MSPFFRRTLVLFALLPLIGCAGVDEMDSNSSSAGMTRLGNMMRDKGEVGTAIDFYRRALTLDRHNAEAIRGLAGVLEMWGDKSAAIEIYEDGVKVIPRDSEIRRGYARLLLAMEEPARAKDQYESALSINPDDLKSRTGLGVALDYLGEHKNAQRQYKLVLDQEPENLSTLNNLAYSYILTRRYDLAIQLLESQLGNPLATAALRQNLALAYGLSGMDADAERVGKMDLSPDKVAKNMAYYRRQRAELAVDTAPYAEVGTYATEGMAAAQIKRLQGSVEKSGGTLRPVIVPEVAAPGGTPRFTVRMMGCARPDDVSSLCETLAKANIPCVARGKGMD